MQARSSYWLLVFLQFFEAWSLNLKFIHLARLNPPASKSPALWASTATAGFQDHNSSPYVIIQQILYHLGTSSQGLFFFLKTVLLYGATTHMPHDITHPLKTYNQQVPSCVFYHYKQLWSRVSPHKEVFYTSKSRSHSVSRDMKPYDTFFCDLSFSIIFRVHAVPGLRTPFLSMAGAIPSYGYNTSFIQE